MHLHAKEILAGVPLEERPLGGLPLQQIGRQRHLPTRDVSPHLLAYPPAQVKEIDAAGVAGLRTAIGELSLDNSLKITCERV